MTLKMKPEAAVLLESATEVLALIGITPWQFWQLRLAAMLVEDAIAYDEDRANAAARADEDRAAAPKDRDDNIVTTTFEDVLQDRADRDDDIAAATFEDVLQNRMELYRDDLDEIRDDMVTARKYIQE